MIKKNTADFYYSSPIVDKTVISTQITILRDHTVYITIDGTAVDDKEYNIAVDINTRYVTVLFKRKRSGKLCVFRISNKQDFLGLGTEKSRDQNEKFFDKLLQYVQDAKRERESRDGTIDTRVDAENRNLFTDTATNNLNKEGKKLRLNHKAYKEYMDFKFKINGYNGAIDLNIPNIGSFGDRCEYIISLNNSYMFKQDAETGISVYKKGYTLIKSITYAMNMIHISELVLYRRLMDNKASKYNVQKAMIGTTSKTARIITGNVTYTCTVEHKFDSIVLRQKSMLPAYDIDFDTQNKIYIDLDGYSVPLYIQNNGITMNGFA